ncbi:MAG TPA: hypothetical protein VK636_07905 [Gemmatimonadaceae bacterium]|nr:hypothetical protein [Gemmatimonadaceae bacterium]
MANITWSVLTAWPANRPKTDSIERVPSSRFKSSFAHTLDELENELDRIDAHDPMIEIDMDRRELRVTGEPRANSSTLKTPGVILHFVDRNKQTITMPCDRYDSWQANVRALFLTLQALRAVDRYGATASGEQYRGWTALPATTTAFTVDQAATFLARLSANGATAADLVANVEAARNAYRRAAANTHPDGGGSTGNFQLVQEAKRVLGAHFGVAL